MSKKLVIGFDGLSGVGKTSVAKYLCQKNKKYLHIELGNLYRAVVPFWIYLKNKYSQKDVIGFMNDLSINYNISNQEIIFVIDSPIKELKITRKYNRSDIYEMAQINEIRQKVYNSLRNIIDRLAGDYIIILVGRELEVIYSNIDYHFYFKANEEDRIIRITERDSVSKTDAKNRKIEEEITHFSSNVIIINSSRLTIREMGNMVENAIKFRKNILKKIQFLGAPSTGKTTISRKCAEKFDGLYAEEKLREYMETRKLAFSDLHNLKISEWCNIIKSQIINEQEIEKKTNKLVFADSGPLLYAIDFNMLNIMDINSLIKKHLKDAGMIFVCDDDIPYIQDGLRPNKDEYDVEKSQYEIIKFLNEENIPYFILTGTREERLETVNQLVSIYNNK